MTLATLSPNSWGRYFHYAHNTVAIDSRYASVPASSHPLLPYGLGRSYGDSCLNADGTLLLTKFLDNFIRFDKTTGVLCCEAGVSLDTIAAVTVPSGWFIPISPGTKFVTLGGAVANDVHGKNHHRAGCFGRHVIRFELSRSNGERCVCSTTDNSDLFAATIGGLGLTGLITWIELQLIPISSALMLTEHQVFRNLDEFFVLCDNSDETHAYTVAWLDSGATGKNLGSGIFMRANHDKNNPESLQNFPMPRLALPVPVTMPNFLLNSASIRAFNKLYFRKQSAHKKPFLMPLEKFFYPLDSVHGWNRVYGKRGFMQFQCVIPFSHSDALRELLHTIAVSGCGSFLSVLKKFGDLPSPGMLSFPMPGYTLALDFANQGEKTQKLFARLTHIVRNAEGKIYPAKDSLMTRDDFVLFYPQWQKFLAFKDPHFSSSFWRRVMSE